MAEWEWNGAFCPSEVRHPSGGSLRVQIAEAQTHRNEHRSRSDLTRSLPPFRSGSRGPRCSDFWLGGWSDGAVASGVVGWPVGPSRSPTGQRSD